ncbi:hypothetical protein BDV23DRAFT_168393 [Aspergillus alliaceus]|uniref:Nephrocystin 3-like N-terminal domain-containing protein n=1 Tax=Petromyces alliaceus TaxID=209559 RepID=A0A5N7CRE6_PETAA|nr:hypothetical protein BDV23DRAFT_168393 [Aspergillus alliaceus]
MHVVLDTVSLTGENVQMKSKLNRDEDLKICDWLAPLLDSMEYQHWLQTGKQILFSPGIPGAGKSIITAIVVDDLYTRFRNDATIGIAYIYCNFQCQDKQTVDGLLLSLLKQTIYSVSDTFSRDFFIVDALDECQASNGCRSRFLSEIFSLQIKSGASIFATSRSIHDITDRFKGCTRLEFRARDEDVQQYLDPNMSKLPAFMEGNRQLKENI